MNAVTLLTRFCLCLLVLGTAKSIHADGPADNSATDVRPIPPEGIDIDDEIRRSLLDECRRVRDVCRTVLSDPSVAPEMAGELLIFPRAVEMTLEHAAIYKLRELEIAAELLRLAERRADIVKRGGSWSEVVGLPQSTDRATSIIGGFRSRLDGSFQPYSLVVPAGWSRDASTDRRMDVWLHGRDEKVHEVAFLNRGRTSLGQYQPNDTFVLHPYGRYSNAFKFAGEVDVFEAMDYVQQRVAVDAQRIAIRGFSMGGAGCWQMATRSTDRWFAANPGAGFSETPLFLKVFQGEDTSDAPDYQRRLWQWYDNPAWAKNLQSLPMVVYSGENDRQKQAADVMEAAMEEVGIDMTHVIGEGMGHKIDDPSKTIIERMLADWAQQPATTPKQLHWTTFTTRYSRCHWLEVHGLIEHWSKATVDVDWSDDQSLTLTTENVSEITLNLPNEDGNLREPFTLMIDNQTLDVTANVTSATASMTIHRDGQTWRAGSRSGLRKRPGLQGPIDDAFLDAFVFVLPSGSEASEDVGNWIAREAEHALVHWQRHFRGDVVAMRDSEITAEIAAKNHLICFGTPQSNSVIANAMAKLPVQWNDESIAIGGQDFDASAHLPVMIYPNPAASDRYLVFNSGFTFREYDYLNNARQTPKLPDWAVVDVRSEPTPMGPGKIVAADFFDERWQPRP